MFRPRAPSTPVRRPEFPEFFRPDVEFGVPDVGFGGPDVELGRMYNARFKTFSLRVKAACETTLVCHLSFEHHTFRFSVHIIICTMCNIYICTILFYCRT